MTSQLRPFLEMIRFSHTVFALPFAMMAAVMAWTATDSLNQQTHFRLQDLVGILVCMVAARSAAMAFNRIVDRKIDLENPRTSARHLPAKKIELSHAIGFTFVAAVTFVAGTLLFLPNRLPLYLSIPVLLVLFTYSYTKRFTSLAHFWLGLSLMLAPVAAWIAIRGDFITENILDLNPAVMLGLAVLFWVAGFDIIYACQDFEFDRKYNLKSIPAYFGIQNAMKIAALCHLMTVVMLITLPLLSSQIGPRLNLGWVYFLAVFGIAALLVYEHWIVRPDDLDRVNVAFFNVNAIISIGLFLLTSIDLLVF